MAHIVKCLNCNKHFDADKVEYIKIGRRYAHKECPEEDPEEQKIKTHEEIDKDNFYQLIKQIYGKDYNYMLINTQAEGFINQYGYTWTGMTKCLYWFYKINHGSIEEGHGGVGIIPFIYDDVKQYYYDLYLAKEKNKMKRLRAPVYEINIQSPRMYERPPHLLDLGED